MLWLIIMFLLIGSISKDGELRKSDWIKLILALLIFVINFGWGALIGIIIFISLVSICVSRINRK